MVEEPRGWRDSRRFPVVATAAGRREDSTYLNSAK